MAQFIINQKFSNKRQVQADYWQVVDGFVVFFKSINARGGTKQILALKPDAIHTIERTGD